MGVERGKSDLRFHMKLTAGLCKTAVAQLSMDFKHHRLHWKVFKHKTGLA